MIIYFAFLILTTMPFVFSIKCHSCLTYCKTVNGKVWLFLKFRNLPNPEFSGGSGQLRL